MQLTETKYTFANKHLLNLVTAFSLMLSGSISCLAEEAAKEEAPKTPAGKDAQPLFPWAKPPGDETMDKDKEKEEEDEDKPPVVPALPDKPPTPPPKQEDDPEKARKFKAQLHAFEAGKLLKQKAYHYAAIEFKAACNFEPENLNYVLGYANTAHKANDWNDAIDAYNRLLKADPSHKEVHKTMGECYSKLGRYDEAVAQYKKAAESEKDKADLWRRIAMIRTGQSKMTEAMEAYRMATKADPTDGKSYKALAAMQWNAGNKAAAISTYKDGVAHNSRDKDLLGAYAYALMSNQQWQEAANAYMAAAKIGGTTPEYDAGYKSAMEHIAYDKEMANRKAEADAKREAKLHPLRGK